MLSLSAFLDALRRPVVTGVREDRPDGAAHAGRATLGE
jgi:hypothetical protein